MGPSLATVATYSILEAIRADRANLAAYSDISVEGGSFAAGGRTRHEQQINAWCKELADTLGTVDTTIGTIDCDDEDRWDERRGGKESVSTCRSQWSQYYIKKNVDSLHIF